jgi:hypothetical protein
MGYRNSWDTEVHGIQKIRGRHKFIGYRSSGDTEVPVIQKFRENRSVRHTVQNLREIRKFAICMILKNTESSEYRAFS